MFHLRKGKEHVLQHQRVQSGILGFRGHICVSFTCEDAVLRCCLKTGCENSLGTPFTVMHLECLSLYCNCALYEDSKCCHLPHCHDQENFACSPTDSDSFITICFSFLFCFVLLFWQLCHGPCLYSFSSSLSNISLNTIAKSGMFVFLTSFFF